MKISTIINMVPTSRLSFNPINRKYFVREEGKELSSLESDIAARGIQVPLIAKKDGVLLAGHRRLLVARKLNIGRVPVQYIQGKMTEAEEIEYLIKDNLMRRQLNPQERDALYRSLYKDFDERILIKNSSMAITADEVTKKTGLNKVTVSYDLNRLRHKRKKEVRAAINVINQREVDSFKRAVSRMLNTAQVESLNTVKELHSLVIMANERLGTLQMLRGK
jgi:hypothetical protein